MTAATARDAAAEVLAFLDDPKVWRGEIEAFTEALYREFHGAPDDVVDIEPGPGAFPLAGDGRGTGEAPDVADDVAGELADLEAGADLTWRELEGACLAGAAHDWRIEWQAADTWHGASEHRTACRRCGLRRARIEAPDNHPSGVQAGLHFLSAADAWPDDPGEAHGRAG